MLKHSFVRFNQTQTKTVLSSARVPLHLSWFSSPDEMLQGPGFDSSVDHFLCVILLTLMASRLYLCQCSQLFLLFMLTVYLHITKYQHSKQKKQDIIDITSLWYIKLNTDITSGLVKHSVMLRALCMSSLKKSDVSYKNKSDHSELPLTGLLPCKRTRIQTTRTRTRTRAALTAGFYFTLSPVNVRLLSVSSI